MIRVFDHQQQIDCVHLAVNSIGCLLFADWNNSRVYSMSEHFKYETVLVDNKQLDNEWPYRLNYNKSNKRLTVGLNNGQVKVFQC